MKIFHSLKTRWVARVWNHTPDCAEMSRLAMRTWLKMRLHYLICAWCKRYFTQLRFLHEAAPHFDVSCNACKEWRTKARKDLSLSPTNLCCDDPSRAGPAAQPARMSLVRWREL